MSIAVQPERIVKSDSAAICASTYLRIWRPVKLILTEGRLICQQASKTLLSIPLSTILGVDVVKVQVILRLRRKALLIDTGKVKRLICVKNPAEWKNLILQLRGGSDSMRRYDCIS